MGVDQKVADPGRTMMGDPFKAIWPFVSHAGYGEYAGHGFRITSGSERLHCLNDSHGGSIKSISCGKWRTTLQGHFAIGTVVSYLFLEQLKSTQ